MIAANSATAKFLEAKKYPSFRRIVRSPKRWERIVELVSDYGFKLPPTPDPKPLSEFLVNKRRPTPSAFRTFP